MEAVGARLGRSSARYGPTTVFSGPVRKWKKKWIQVAPPSSASKGSSRDRDRIQSSQSANASDSSNGSHVVLYKWTPISQRENSVATGETTPVDDDGIEEPPRRKLKFIPIALLEEQNNEASGHYKEKTKADEAAPSTDEQASKSNSVDKKPDMNDTPMKDSEDTDGEQEERQDLNKSALDLSLGLTSHDDGNDSKTDGD